jgi:hypothetical protein
VVQRSQRVERSIERLRVDLAGSDGPDAVGVEDADDVGELQMLDQ